MIPRSILHFCLFICCLSASGQSAGSSDSGNPLGRVFIKHENDFAGLDYGVVALYRDRSGHVYKSAAGWAAPKQKMTADKVFNIGSLTKMFTAVLVLQDVENGRLRMNDSIGKFFTRESVNNPNVDLSITVGQLLRQRSGLGEVIVDTIVNQCFQDALDPFNNSCQLGNIPAPTGRKGEKYEYCNTNYLLLGNILELINDRPYDVLLNERIFRPCGMINSYSYFSKTIPDAVHPMYEGRDLFDLLNFRFFRYYNFSAGCISSTLDDLLSFFNHLYNNNTLLKPGTFLEMTSFEDGKGMGIELYTAKLPGGRSLRLYGHDGDNLSFKCRNYYDPETREQIIFLSNCYGEKMIRKMTNELLINTRRD